MCRQLLNPLGCPKGLRCTVRSHPPVTTSNRGISHSHVKLAIGLRPPAKLIAWQKYEQQSLVLNP